MFPLHREHVRLSRRGLSRRGFLTHLSAGAVAAGTLSLSDRIGLHAEELKKQGRSLILLWMGGGPSQLETFDPKPEHENGGGTEVIGTSVSGIQVAKGWERTAALMDEFAVIRSMTNREGNHQRASYQLHTGYIPTGSVKHPAFGSNVAYQIAPEDLDLPSVVSIGGGRGFGSGIGQSAGYLGVDYDPFVVADPSEPPSNTEHPVGEPRYQRRLGLLDELETDFAERGGRVPVNNHRRIYDKASRMILSRDLGAFDISKESATVRKEYGETEFGRGCLLARRLIERGVTFVEVRSNGWDTHADNNERVGSLASQVDPGMAALVADLKRTGRLETTTVLWMGEFGRTPKLNPRGGRDHFPRAFSVAMAGGGVRGGQVIGSTTADGMAVNEQPVSVGDLLATVCKSVGVDQYAETMSPLGRPMRVVDEGVVIDEVFTG